MLPSVGLRVFQDSFWASGQRQQLLQEALLLLLLLHSAVFHGDGADATGYQGYEIAAPVCFLSRVSAVDQAYAWNVSVSYSFCLRRLSTAACCARVTSVGGPLRLHLFQPKAQESRDAFCRQPLNLLRQSVQRDPAPSWLKLQQRHRTQHQVSQQQQSQSEDWSVVSRLLSVATGASAFLLPKAAPLASPDSSGNILSVDWDGQDEAVYSHLLQLKLLVQQQAEETPQQNTQLGWVGGFPPPIGSAPWARQIVQQYLYLREQGQQDEQQKKEPHHFLLPGTSLNNWPPLPPPVAFADRLLLFGHLLAGASAAADPVSKSPQGAVAGVAAALCVRPSVLCLSLSPPVTPM